MPAAAQQQQQGAQPGDQLFTFGVSQTFAANDNLRLDPTSAGTTFYSDTKLSLGFDSLTQQQQFNFDISGVLRAVDDPVIGTDAELRDPSVDLFFNRTNGRERLTAYASYDRPDLAFLDPLTLVDINGQDITNGEGSREDIRAGITLETGLQGPLGFLIDVNTRERNYIDNNDPALFGNRTDNARVQVNLQLSPVATGRFYATAREYQARNNQSTQTDTDTVGFGVTRDLDPATVLSFDLGYSKVDTTTQTVPPSGGNPTIPGTQTLFEGYVAAVGLSRQVPDGRFTADLDSVLNRSGRQSTLEFGRSYVLPRGRFAFSFGATTGDSFEVQPVGSLSYTLNSPRSSFNASLSRAVRIDETLDQLTETTRAGIGYNTRITPLSSIDLAVNYANIAVIGNNTNNAGRDRVGATAAYVRDVGDDWKLRLGYGYRSFDPNSGASAQSNEVFFTLSKTFDRYR